MSRVKNYYDGLLRSRKFNPDISELIIFITNACNLYCKHCFYSAELRQPIVALTLEQYEKIVTSIRVPMANIILTGGEPFLHPDISRIVKLFGDQGKARQFTIPSNGRATELVLSRAEECLKNFSGNIHVQISLDGLAAYHNQLRGDEQTFSSVLKTISGLKELAGKYKHLSVGVNTTVSRQNMEMLDELAEFVNKELKVAHNFELIRGTNFMSETIDHSMLSDFKPKEEGILVPNLSEIQALNTKLDQLLYRNSLYAGGIPSWLIPFFYAFKSTQEFYLSERILSRKKNLKHCKAGKSMGVIYPDGGFAFCEMTKVVAKLSDYDYDLYKLWNDEALKKKAERLKCYCTHGCFIPPEIIYDNKLRFRLLAQLMKYFRYKL
jgi:MoaA/NifB/PqqE/SkfB family radical SAM enzyme